MRVDVAEPTLIGFLLAVVRIGAWLLIAPPFATRAIPTVVKAALAFALALPVVSTFAAHAPSSAVGELVPAILGQVIAGLALGFITSLLVAVVQAAGELVDLFGGFTLASVYDPLSQNQSGPFGRVNQLVAITLLFATDAHLLLVHGILSSISALPLTGNGQLGSTLVSALTRFFFAALEVAAPVLAVLFLTDIALALLSRAAPALNVFSLSFPVKILVTLLVVGVALPLLPGAVDAAVRSALHAGQHLGIVGH